MKLSMKMLLKLALAFFLLWLLLGHLDWQQGLYLLRQVNILLVLAALLLFPLGIWLSTVKWALLLRAQGVFMPSAELLRCYWIGFFANNFLPSSIGGDVSRVALLRQRGQLSKIAASIAAERLTGVFLLILWGAGILAAQGERLVGREFFLPLLAAVVMVALVLAAIFFWSGLLSRRLLAIAQAGSGTLRTLAGKVGALAAEIAAYREKRSALFVAVVLSIPFYMTPCLFQWLLFRAFSLPVSLWSVFMATPLINLIGLIPATPNALGLTEGAYVLFYGRLGVGPEEALAVALVARMLGLVASLFGGLLWLLRRREADGR